MESYLLMTRKRDYKRCKKEIYKKHIDKRWGWLKYKITGLFSAGFYCSVGCDGDGSDIYINLEAHKENNEDGMIRNIVYTLIHEYLHKGINRFYYEGMGRWRCEEWAIKKVLGNRT